MTLLVRALRLLRPTEFPVRPCSVPRDANVFMAAPALDPAVDPAAETQDVACVQTPLKFSGFTETATGKGH